MAADSGKVFTVPSNTTDPAAKKSALAKGIASIAEVASKQKAAGRSVIFWKVDVLYLVGAVEALGKALK